MKCFLINPNYPQKHDLLLPVPPLGLASIAAVLETQGLEVKVEDQFASNISNESLSDRIISYNPSLIGISCLTPCINHTADLVQLLKNKGFRGSILLGNVHATIFAEDLLQRNIGDIIIHGEGEDTVRDLIKALQNEQSLETVKGISFKGSQGKLTHTPNREQIQDLDTLPIPAWHLFDLSYYASAPMLQVYGLALPVQSSRGCPERCIFCGQEIFYKKIKFRTVDNLMKEIDCLASRFNIRYFIFADANFPVTKKYGLEFCEKFKKSSHFKTLRWCTELKPDIVDSELLNAMKEAGCTLIEYGFEVGNQQILKMLNKKTTLEDAKHAMKLTRAANIQTLGLFMIGLPGEGIKEIFQTFFLAIRLGCDMAKFNITIPVPGSKLFEMHKEELMKNFHPETYSSWYRPPKNGPPITTVPGCLPPNLLQMLQCIGMLLFYGRPFFILSRLFHRTLSIKDMSRGGSFILYELLKSIRSFFSSEKHL
jgi:anaerobic magnesium-protoporphyrin IX monomethyl ester cyclase